MSYLNDHLYTAFITLLPLIIARGKTDDLVNPNAKDLLNIVLSVRVTNNDILLPNLDEQCAQNSELLLVTLET